MAGGMEKTDKSGHEGTYKDRIKNPVLRWLDKRMDKIYERETDKYIRQYATNSNGSIDEYMAGRIRYEMMRRNQMGREIDVYEPLRWAVYSGILGVFTGGGAKIAHEHYSKNNVENRAVENALVGAAFASFASSFLLVGRIFSLARFKAGLYAAAQVAISTPGREYNPANHDKEHDGNIVAAMQMDSPQSNPRVNDSPDITAASLAEVRKPHTALI